LTKPIYILSGLGADERVFQKLDFSNYSPVFIKWIAPNFNESIENYATRLLEQMPTYKPILIGLSFGGIIATEIAKQIETEQVILIASAKTKNEIPFYYRFAGFIKLHKLIPATILKQSNFIANWLFGAKTLNEKLLLKSILKDTDSHFLKWAIEKIVTWKNITRLNNLTHIHGLNDHIIPHIFLKCDIRIEGGGHFMTMNKDIVLSEIIKKQLDGK
jgi:pimeloyl-ACP methyl ester carboxylesterase